MHYNVKGTGIQISDEIRTYIEKRFQHADTFLENDTTAHADVELEYQTSEERPKYRAEFTLQSRQEVYRAEAIGSTLHEAIDSATNELTKEVSRSKKKRLSLVRRGAGKFKDFIRGFRKKF